MPAENIINFCNALKKAGANVEMHLYVDAAHGFSLAPIVTKSYRLRPEAFPAFARDAKLIPKR